MKLFSVLAYNAVLVFGTAYIVFWKGHSGWWFLLTIVFCATIETKEQNK